MSSRRVEAPSWLRTVSVALFILLVGLGLLWLGDGMPENSGWRAFLFNLGSFVVATVAIGLIFQFWQLRGLIEDLRREVGMTEEFTRSGIRTFATEFHNNIPWAELFARSDRARIAFAYGRTWRNSQKAVLHSFLARQGTSLEVVLPNPSNGVVIDEMALRFDTKPSELVGRIEEAARDFEQLVATTAGSVQIRYYDASLLFSFYLFNGGAVFSTYCHGPDRGSVVTLQLDASGEFYRWLTEQWAILVTHSVREDGGGQEPDADGERQGAASD